MSWRSCAFTTLWFKETLKTPSQYGQVNAHPFHCLRAVSRTVTCSPFTEVSDRSHLGHFMAFFQMKRAACPAGLLRDPALVEQDTTDRALGPS
jgi:hypothetical protein